MAIATPWPPCGHLGLPPPPPRIGIAPHRQGVLEAMDQGRIAYTEYQQTIELIRVDGDTAIVMGSEIVRTDPQNDPVQRRFTHVWIRRDDTWLLLARHAHLID
jgi:ketosteroid isomerase-like protein